MKIRFEKTQYGWKAFVRRHSAYHYAGHFRTQREAREILTAALAPQWPFETFAEFFRALDR